MDLEVLTSLTDAQAAAYASYEGMRAIGRGIATIAMFGSGIGEGILIKGALEAMGRNPDVSGMIFTRMIIGVALAESTAIYAFVAFFLL